MKRAIKQINDQMRGVTVYTAQVYGYWHVVTPSFENGPHFSDHTRDVMVNFDHGSHAVDRAKHHLWMFTYVGPHGMTLWRMRAA